MSKSIITNTADIQNYVRDIRKIPVITHERQNEIFTLLKSNKITSAEKNKLYEELIIGNLRFVISIAKSYQNQGLDIMDLISEGNIGLIKAAERFDPSNDVRFISYAVWWIRQSIMASLNDNARTIRIPSNLVQEAQKQKRIIKNDVDNSHINPMNNEDNMELNLPYCIGLYSQINDDGDQLIDLIPNQNSDNPEDVVNSIDEIKKKVSFMLNILDDREKKIIERYYGLTGIESNLEDLGEELGCTKERIRQLKDKALKKLRNESFSLLKYL